MIRLGTKKIIPFYEDYKPVEVRRNNVRIAGWLTETKSGEAVDFENTYNDKAEVLVHGNSMQDGEPSPENPVPVLSAGECNLLISDRTGVRQSIALPPLRKIGDVADTYNPVTGEYVQRIKELPLAEAGFGIDSQRPFDGFNLFHSFNQLQSNNQNSRYTVFCTHLLNDVIFSVAKTGIQGSTVVGQEDYYYLRVPESLLLPYGGYTAAALNAWATAENVFIYFILAEPIITYLAPAQVPTYYPYTRIGQDGQVKGTIEARVKVVEG